MPTHEALAFPCALVGSKGGSDFCPSLLTFCFPLSTIVRVIANLFAISSPLLPSHTDRTWKTSNSMARLPLTSLVAGWTVLLFSALLQSAKAQSGLSPLCSRFRAGCERVCSEDFNTSPSNFVCLVKTPSCVCGGNRSVAPYAAMRGMQAAISAASNLDEYSDCRSHAARDHDHM